MTEMEYHFELGELITRPLMDEIKELEEIKRKVREYYEDYKVCNNKELSHDLIAVKERLKEILGEK